MFIEFDAAKDRANIAKHGVSLAMAASMEVTHYERVVRNGEARMYALGLIDGKTFSLTFVFRANAIRPISLRRARPEEFERMMKRQQGLNKDQIPFDSSYDDDNPEWTEERLAAARPASELPDEVLEAFANKRMRGKQKAPRKQSVSIRLSPEVIAYFKAGGPGWQTRIDDVLRAATGTKRDG